MRYRLPMCLMCKRKHPDPPEGQPETCDAFPDGIPAGIWIKSGDHTKPWKGDNGLRFERDPDVFPGLDVHDR